MTVEERIGSVPRQVAPPDRFPVGMRVLAVDDDPTCLRVLENLLRLCQYHVTTTNQAVTALKLLRENRDKFDLVISDVHMPDMDGFKLLELVGLEMDLPVIMLSANSDTKAVMKGITHGACDYLLKPVRLEELKNIWQHVVRRRKFETRDTSLRDHDNHAEKYQHPKSDVRHNPDDETPDSICKFNRKRKDQNEEEEDSEENGRECEDPSSQKKPRVVWSPELHKKFVDAVNQLGIDKAVPKRILDLMNVERLTRENVASHLQKFRLYLKRIQVATSQQANIFAALGGRDCYLPMRSMDGMGNIHALARPRQFPALTSFQTGAAVGRMNSPTNIGFQGLSSNGMIQLGQANNNIGNSNHIVRNIGQINLSGVPEGNVLGGLPTINHFQQHKTANETSCQFPGYLSNLGVPSDSNNLCCNNSGNIFTLQGQSGELDIQSSSRRTLENDPFHICVGISHLPDSSTCNDTWPDAAPLGGYSANTLPLNTSLGDENSSSSIILKDRISLIGSKCDNSHSASISNVMVSTVLEQLASSSQYHNSSGADGLSIPTGVTESLRISDFPIASNSQQKLEDHRQDQCARPTLECGSHLNSLPTAHGISITDILDVGQDGMLYDIKLEASGINQSNLNAPFFEQQTETNNYQMKAKNDSFMPPSKLPSGLSSNTCNSYEELMNTMLNAVNESSM